MPAAAITDQFLLTGKVALVTGGSRGLGREMILAFAQAGADVVIASRKRENCEALAVEVTETTGRKALAIGCHVGDWGQIDAMVDQTFGEFGRIDVLVNNAGMSPLYENLAGHTEALYDKVFDVNLKGPFRLMANVGTKMADTTGGSIINVSSVAAERPRPGTIPYSAAKAGLNAMTVAFAHAFGPNVRVNAIQAGPFLTDISKAWNLEAVAKEYERTLPMKRAGEPAEIVGAALYFASDASRWTTGSILRVDGGVP